ncbi:MAG: hypothetical protein ACR2IF_11630 [Terriglobales bacterium]
MPNKPPRNDVDGGKGAVEQDRRSQNTNTSLNGQLAHRTNDPLVKASDSDFPEPDGGDEHTGEREDYDLARKAAVRGGAPRGTPANEDDPEGAQQDQDPDQRPKQNQGGKKDDPLAA